MYWLNWRYQIKIIQVDKEIIDDPWTQLITICESHRPVKFKLRFKVRIPECDRQFIHAKSAVVNHLRDPWIRWRRARSMNGWSWSTCFLFTFSIHFSRIFHFSLRCIIGCDPHTLNRESLHQFSFLFYSPDDTASHAGCHQPVCMVSKWCQRRKFSSSACIVIVSTIHWKLHKEKSPTSFINVSRKRRE